MKRDMYASPGTEYERLITELANWEKEENPFKYNSAYLIKGEIPDNNKNIARIYKITIIAVIIFVGRFKNAKYLVKIDFCFPNLMVAKP